MNGLRVEAKIRGAGTGEQYLQRAIADLGIWGGMDNTEKADEDGYQGIGFDLNKVQGQLPTEMSKIKRLVDWLDGWGVDYSLTLHRWMSE